MTRLALRGIYESFSVVAVLALLVGTIASLTCGCGGEPVPSAENALKQTSYGAQLAVCNVQAKSFADSRECRCLVAQAWGRICLFPADGGSDG